jgi:hypothetical protein
MMAKNKSSKRGIREMLASPFATLKRISGFGDGATEKPPETELDRYAQTRREGSPIGGVGFSQRNATNYYLSRAQKYGWFEEMDDDPMVSSVLDTYAAEATQMGIETNRIVWVESANSTIANIVNSFLARVDADANAYSIIRDMTKYGDVFEGLPCVSGQGAIHFSPYYPMDVMRINDPYGRLLGFCPLNMGVEQAVIHSLDSRSYVPPYGCLHFRIFGRKRIGEYGDSLLDNSRESWRDLQMVEDQVMIQRLMRAPDRLLVLLDTAGMSLEDTYRAIKRYEQELYRSFKYNPSSGDYASNAGIFAENKDIVLPLGDNNQTRIENYPATNQNDLLRDLDYFLSIFLGGLSTPKGFFGFGDGAGFDASQTLSRQDTRFAKNVARIQTSFLFELTRAAMIDLAYKGIDPLQEKNAFSLQMTPTSYFMELERSELLSMRADLVERYISLGQNNGFDSAVWVPYILIEYGKMHPARVKQLLKKHPPTGVPAGMTDEDGDGDYFEGRNVRNEIAPQLLTDAKEYIVESTPIELPREVRMECKSRNVAIGYPWLFPEAGTQLLESADLYGRMPKSSSRTEGRMASDEASAGQIHETRMSIRGERVERIMQLAKQAHQIVRK